MPRLALSVPRYRRHKASGQAVVTLHGVDHYLGPHGSDASRTQYDRLIAEYLANGRRRIVDRSISVNVLAAEFLPHVAAYYLKEGQPTSEQWEYRTVASTACRLYGDQMVDSFGPIALKACRQEWIDSGVTRQTINKRQFRLVRMFKWGVAEELVDSAVWESLRSVDTLHIGRTPVPEMKEVPPVELDRVQAVTPFLSPVVRDMISLQLITGMRPGEVCRLRPGDLDRSSDVWEFNVLGHKTAHHGRKRTVYIGPEAQSVLRPYLLRAADQHCFSAAESREWWFQQAEEARVTPASCGNARGRKHDRTPSAKNSRLPRTYFDRVVMAGRSPAACKKAWPAPKEIRGDKEAVKAWDRRTSLVAQPVAAYSRDRSAALYGLDAAQVILGHARADITQVYAEVDRQKAIDITRKIG